MESENIRIERNLCLNFVNAYNHFLRFKIDNFNATLRKLWEDQFDVETEKCKYDRIGKELRKWCDVAGKTEAQKAALNKILAYSPTRPDRPTPVPMRWETCKLSMEAFGFRSEDDEPATKRRRISTSRRVSAGASTDSPNSHNATVDRSTASPDVNVISQLEETPNSVPGSILMQHSSSINVVPSLGTLGDFTAANRQCSTDSASNEYSGSLLLDNTNSKSAGKINDLTMRNECLNVPLTTVDAPTADLLTWYIQQNGLGEFGSDTENDCNEHEECNADETEQITSSSDSVVSLPHDHVLDAGANDVHYSAANSAYVLRIVPACNNQQDDLRQEPRTPCVSYPSPDNIYQNEDAEPIENDPVSAVVENVMQEEVAPQNSSVHNTTQNDSNVGPSRSLLEVFDDMLAGIVSDNDEEAAEDFQRLIDTTLSFCK